MQANGTGEAEPITAINITPLVDVSLVLVIIFMMTMPFLLEQAFKVKSSQEKVVAVSSVMTPILVEISQAGLQLEGREIARTDLVKTLGQMIQEREIFSVAVSADPQITHGQVVEVLDEVVEAGAQELNLLEPEVSK